MLIGGGNKAGGLRGGKGLTMNTKLGELNGQ